MVIRRAWPLNFSQASLAPGSALADMSVLLLKPVTVKALPPIVISLSSDPRRDSAVLAARRSTEAPLASSVTSLSSSSVSTTTRLFIEAEPVARR